MGGQVVGKGGTVGQMGEKQGQGIPKQLVGLVKFWGGFIITGMTLDKVVHDWNN